MAFFNRGEWSEIYALLDMLIHPNLVIGNSNLEIVTKELYQLKSIKIISKSKNSKNLIEYSIKNKNEVAVYFNDDLSQIVSEIELCQNKQMIFEAIKNASTGNGSFDISLIKGLLMKLTKGNKIKSGSFKKEDLSAIVFDRNTGRDVSLKYSIKSSLGNPATLLNASVHTNFLFSVSGLSSEDVKAINDINTSSKLLDKINKIIQCGGKIQFVKTTDETFGYNLRMIDTKMPEYLANVLVDSYLKKEKSLKELFLNSNQFEDESFAIKKLGDLLEGISFGFFPSKKWYGTNDVNGGLVIIKHNGDVLILDLIYFRDEVINYLINETRLDSPSSTRYNMLKLFFNPTDNKCYFTLNLQIRYKK